MSGDTNGRRDVFVRDRDTDADGVFDEGGAVRTTRVSVTNDGAQGNGFSTLGAIAADGRHVSFHSDSSNLTSGDANGFGDVFLRDLRAGKTIRISVSTSGAEGYGGAASQLSGNGR